VKALATLALVAGCSTAKPHTITQATRDDFKKRCAPCHGETGHADGPAVVKLDRKPPDFADAAWQQSVSDEEIKKAIVEGGGSVGKSKMMPPIHDLGGTPELDELVLMIRSSAAR
jgi:mono/diheme cytochrome c family protein